MIGLDELLTDCDARGVRLLPDGNGGLTIDAPRGALTPDLISRLKEHKSELLLILTADGPTLPDARAAWLGALDRLKGDPDFAPDLLLILRQADAQWAPATN